MHFHVKRTRSARALVMFCAMAAAVDVQAQTAKPEAAPQAASKQPSAKDAGGATKAGATAKAEPGGYPTHGPVVTMTTRDGGKCQIYFPAELFSNPKIFRRPAAPADLVVHWYGVFAPDNCKKPTGQFAQSPKEQQPIVFTYKHNARQEKVVGWSPRTAYPFTAKIDTRFVDGRMHGPVGIELVVRDDVLADWAPVSWGKKTLKYDTSTQFIGFVYYRDGQMFLTKEDYERPETERQAKKQRIAALAKARDNAINTYDCEKAKDLDAQLGQAGAFQRCEQAVADKRLMEAREADQKRAADELNDLKNRRSAAIAAAQCDEVKQLDERLQSNPGLEDCKLVLQSKTGSANELYIAGGRYEQAGNRVLARMFFKALVDRFPNDDLAIKASDNLSAMARVEAVENSNAAAAEAATRAQRDQQQAIEQAGRDAQARQAQGQQAAREEARRQCITQRSDCERGCDGRYPSGNARIGCKQGCPSCFQF